MGLFLGSVFCSVDLWNVFMPMPYVLILVALQRSLKSGSVLPPALFFFLKIALGSLWFHTNYRIGCSISEEKCHWHFDRDVLNL